MNAPAYRRTRGDVCSARRRRRRSAVRPFHVRFGHVDRLLDQRLPVGHVILVDFVPSAPYGLVPVRSNRSVALRRRQTRGANQTDWQGGAPRIFTSHRFGLPSRRNEISVFTVSNVQFRQTTMTRCLTDSHRVARNTLERRKIFFSKIHFKRFEFPSSSCRAVCTRPPDVGVVSCSSRKIIMKYANETAVQKCL